MLISYILVRDKTFWSSIIPGDTPGNSWWGCAARFSKSCPDFTAENVLSAPVFRPGARFSKVPIINGPGKLSPFTLKIEVSIVLHIT